MFLAFVALAAAAVVALALPNAGWAYSGATYTWVWQNPHPNGHCMLGVDALDSTNVWSVGEGGAIMFWNGTTLTAQTSGTTNNLYDVAAANTTNVWAVGANGTILKYNGTSWASQAIGGMTYDLKGVTAIMDGATPKAWAVGSRDGWHNATICYYNGTSWSSQEPACVSGGLQDVFAVDATHVYAVDIDTYFCSNGTTWSKINTGSHGPPEKMPYKVSGFTTASVYYLWAVSWDGTILESRDGGSTWGYTYSQGSSPINISAFYSSGVYVYIAGWGGDIRKYSGSIGSGTWTTQTSGTTNDLYDVSVLGTANIYAVGSEKFLTSAGTTWTAQSGGTPANLRGVSALSATTVWGVGDYNATYGNIRRTTDGGTIWSTLASGTTINNYCVDAFDTTHYWVAGAPIGSNTTIRFSANGSTWSSQYSATPAETVNCINAAATNRAWAGTSGSKIRYYQGSNWTSSVYTAAAAVNGVFAASTTRVWAVGATGKIYSTSTGGTAFSQQTSNTTADLNAVWAASTTTAWAVGNGGVIRYTSNSGSTWQTQDVGGMTQNLYGVYGLNTDNVWAVGANGTILYYHGGSWSQQTSPTTNTLRAVYAQDTSHIWAVGDSGTIIFADPPYITSCSPNWGNPGTTVKVRVVGGYTSFSGSSTLDFGSGVTMKTGTLNFIDPSTVEAELEIAPDAEPGPRDVNVITGTELPIPLSGGFVVGPDPAIVGVSPSSAEPGWTGEVLITGNQTHFDLTSQAVLGPGVTANYIEEVGPEGATLNVTVSPDAAGGPRDVNVTTGTEVPKALAGGFNVNSVPPTPTAPVVTGVSPPTGPPGTAVTVLGSNFGSTQGDSYVNFNGVKATQYIFWSDTEIVVIVPEGAASGPVQVFTPQGGSNNDKSFDVTKPASTWYLAEGSTAWGFNTRINIMNPNNTTEKAVVTYMTPSGPVKKPELNLPPMSQTSLDPRADIGYDTDFSTKVECMSGDAIAVDRTMTWTGEGTPSPEGHSSIGVTSPSKTWYLPEGSSAWGFETWTLVENPNPQEAKVTLTYMIEGQGLRSFEKTVPAYSRATYNMCADLQQQVDASIELSSDTPVITEGSMYRNNRREGSCSIGATAPASDFFLAEGTTAWGFTTYVLVQNPQNTPTDVTVTYMTPTGPVYQTPFNMPANSRKTIRVNDIPEVSNTDFSTQVHGTLPIIAERAMYWDKGSGEACHDSIGMASPHATFYLPDGQSSSGRETWTLVQNPNDTNVTVDISYLTPDGSGNVKKTETIAANSRRTFSMAEHSGISGRAAIQVVSTTSGKNIMVERSMYWNSRGAGTDTIGGFGD